MSEIDRVVYPAFTKFVQIADGTDDADVTVGRYVRLLCATKKKIPSLLPGRREPLLNGGVARVWPPSVS